jgi:hypothetical protein
MQDGYLRELFLLFKLVLREYTISNIGLDEKERLDILIRPTSHPLAVYDSMRVVYLHRGAD